MAKKKKKTTKKKVAKKKVIKKKAPKKKAVKKKKRKANPALLKKLDVSADLAVVLGTKKASRGQVMKLIWKYIKAHKGIQDGRNINPDEKLAKVFGSKKTITMFQMAGKLSKHLS